MIFSKPYADAVAKLRVPGSDVTTKTEINVRITSRLRLWREDLGDLFVMDAGSLWV